jgi:hypothetical protein
MPDQKSGYDQLAGASPIAVNVMVDGAGAVARRPGLLAYGEAPASSVDANGIVGLHAASDGALYAVGGHPTVKSVYRIAGGLATELSTTGKLIGSSRPVAAETEALIVFAAGGGMYKVERSGGAAGALGGSPPTASHVIANASRLLANDMTIDRSKVRYTSPAAGTVTYAGHEEWTVGVGSAGFFSAEARPDPIVALHENTNEVFAFGTTNVQVFSPDDTFIYSPSNTREYGCAAPYAIIRDDQSFVWIDDKRRIVRSDGRGFEVLSNPIKRTLDSMSTVSDAYGYRVHTGALDAFVFTFPTGGRTLVFQKGAGWSTWAGWSNTTSTFQAFSVLSHALTVGGNENVVGLSDGRVAKLDVEAGTDLGEAFWAGITTGFQDRGTSARKQCKAVHLTLRRGVSSDAYAQLQWRDDEGPWGDPCNIPLGPAGDRQPVVTLRSLGVYRKRDWRFSFHGTASFALASAEEEFEVLAM